MNGWALNLLLYALALLVAAAPFMTILGWIVNARRHRKLRQELRTQLDALRAELDRLRSDLRGVREAPTATMERRAAPVTEPTAPVPEAEPSVAAPLPSAIPTPPPPPPPPPPPLRPKPPREAPPPPPARRRGLDWETWLGLRGAAIVGAVSLAIAGVLFARWSIERGFFTPEMRFALLLAGGIGSLLGAELVLRRGYRTTSNALCGAGVALLYVGLYAGHVLYDLIGFRTAFALMALTTVVAGLMAIRYGSLLIAVLALLGGFATPVALSSGVDRPLGLFSYILLLNVGALAIAARNGWTGLAGLVIAGTLAIQLLWSWRFLTPAKLFMALIVYGGFGLLYLGLPAAAGAADRRRLMRLSIVGALVPFVFGLAIAGMPDFADRWPMLFSYVGLLGAASAIVGAARGQSALHVAAALATAGTIGGWLHASGRAPAGAAPMGGPALAVLGLTLMHVFLPRLAERLAPPMEPAEAEGERRLRAAAGLLMLAALAVYLLWLIDTRQGEPPWVVLALLAGGALGALERTRPGPFEGPTAVIAPAALALLAQGWFFVATQPATLARNVALPVLLAAGWTAATVVRFGRRPATRPGIVRAHAWGAALAVSIPLGALFFIDQGPRWMDELSTPVLLVFGPLAALSALLVVLAMNPRGSTLVLLLGVVAAGARAHLFNVAERWTAPPGVPMMADWELRLGAYGALYAAWLLLPFVVPRRWAPAWAWSPWPWVASAMAGPAMFYPIYRVVVHVFGRGWIGALPLAMAAASLVALTEVRRRFAPSPDPDAARVRLRNLTLFAAVVMGFLALAVPLQLERQWIAIGWALEAAAVWWLYLRLPHAGLKYFGMGLMLAVGVRLLLNPAVLTYGRGGPILNWILYTYGVAALSCLIGAAWLRRVEDARLSGRERAVLGPVRFAPAAAMLGILLIFALINLEIADYYTPRGAAVIDFGWRRRYYPRDLTYSIAWGVYAVVLLVIGIWRNVRPLRLVALGFLLLTVFKVFLLDLSKLRDIYRVLSFLGMAASLILVSLLYQRFVLADRRGAKQEEGL